MSLFRLFSGKQCSLVVGNERLEAGKVRTCELTSLSTKPFVIRFNFELPNSLKRRYSFHTDYLAIMWQIFRQFFFIPKPPITGLNCPDQTGRVCLIQYWAHILFD